MKKLTDQQVDDILGGSCLERIGPYRSNKSPLHVRCRSCGHERSTNTGHLIYSIRHGRSPCPKCSGLIPHTNESVDERLSNRKITRLTDWVNDSTSMMWECGVCGHRWETRATKIINDNTGCPECSYEHRYDTLRLTDEIIDERIEGRSIKRGEAYPGSLKTKMKWECLECGYEWMATTDKVVNEYTGCPSCADVGGGRFGRRVLREGELFDSQLEYDCYLVLLNNIGKNDIIRQRHYPHNARMRCDFYLPKQTTWIEVSNLKTSEYVKNIENKRKAIETIGERFIFVRSPREMQALTHFLIY